MKLFPINVDFSQTQLAHNAESSKILFDIIIYYPALKLGGVMCLMVCSHLMLSQC
jgi:hypothetical protein